MSRNLKIAIGFIVVVAIVGVGAFLYLTRDLDAPTTPIEDTVERLVAATSEVTREVDGTGAGEATTEAVGGQVVYRIAPTESSAEYNIGEILNGSAITVVGTTSELAGDILVDFGTPANSQIGTINVNARTFATGQRQRDNAVARFLLQAESVTNEFISFEATDISGLPETITVGEPINLQITGNLTLAGVTQTVTFEATATLASEDQLVGTAETTVNYADYNISIMAPPTVSGIDDQVIFKLNFVAYAVES